MSEKGRSMLEVIGVLVLIGILSIGSILGYNYAINKYHANVILNDVRRITVFLISSDFLGKENLTLDKLDIEVESAAPYEIAKETKRTFYITAGNINQKICDILIQQKPMYAENVSANAMSSQKCEAADNKVYFYINADMNSIPDEEKPQDCTLDAQCGICGVCTAGRCIDADSKCPSGQYCVNGTCGCAKGQVRDTNGRCYQCADQTVLVASQTQCDKCTNRVSFMTGGSKKGQQQCATCPDGSNVNATHSGCVCGNGMFWNHGGYGDASLCSSCSNTTYAHAKQEECHKCANQFAAESETCYGCLSTGASLTLKTTLENCNRCSNRHFNRMDQCVTCSPGTVKDSDGNGCTGCPGGQFWHSGYSYGSPSNACAVCSNTTEVYAPVSECHKCPNQFAGFSKEQGNIATCYGCLAGGYSEIRNSTLDACNRCSNRYFNTSTEKCIRCPDGQRKNASGTGCE